MFEILKKDELNADVTRMLIKAPEIAAAARAGQFVSVIADQTGERIPLTLNDWDSRAGTITLIFQKVGFSTKKLGSFLPGDTIAHILGPLGHPTEAANFGTVICIAGGVGVAEVYPVSRAFKSAGNRVIAIIGARSRDLLILEEPMRQVCDELEVATDDGSYGRKGFVTDALKDRLSRETPQRIYAIGPVPMMKAVADATRASGIKTIVSVNPIMVDATGMCGACRCKVGGKTVFGCVDGPDFDAHALDFDELARRLK